MSPLASFEAELVHLIGRPTTLRPLICEGSPLAAQVFIVGYNPASRIEGDWWSHWQPGYGFRKSDWQRAYLAARGRPSKTRARIDAIVAALPEVAVVETNIDARPSARKSTYPDPDTRIFDLLLTRSLPKVIIAHGVDAVAHLERAGVAARIIPCRHFIYVGHQRTAEIVAEARRELGLPARPAPAA